MYKTQRNDPGESPTINNNGTDTQHPGACFCSTTVHQGPGHQCQPSNAARQNASEPHNSKSRSVPVILSRLTDSKQDDSQKTKGSMDRSGWSFQRRSAGENGASKDSSAASTQGSAKSANAERSCDPELDDWASEFMAGPQNKGLWQGLDGRAVMTFGVALPGFLIALCASSMAKRLTLVLISHPVETLVELALVCCIPIMNYLVWSSICQSNVRFSRTRDIALGATIGASLIVCIVCAAGLFVASRGLVTEIGTEFATGFAFISAAALMAACAGIYLVHRIRLTRELPKSRAQLIGHAATGAVLCLVTVVAAETRPWCVRIAERMAVSSSAADRLQGLNWLRSLNPERELRIECADHRAAGLSGLFIPVNSIIQHQLYFALTGKPYSYRDSHNNDLSSLLDDCVSRDLVGGKRQGLSLVRSKIDGRVHPDTLSATVDWTMVFKTDSPFLSCEKVLAELKAPQGAVVTGLRILDAEGQHDASFAATADSDSSTTTKTHLGRDRLLLDAGGLKEGEERKVQVTMVIPLKPDGPKSSTLVLPRFIASNFGLSGEHQVRLRSSMRLSSGMAGLKEWTSAVGEKVLFGNLPARQLDSSDLMVTASRSAVNGTIAVPDKLAEELEQAEEERREKGRTEPIRIKAVKPRYVRLSIEPIASPPPRHLVVVVDGSVTVGSYKADLCKALERLPANIPTSLCIASQERKELMEPVSLARGIERLRNMHFVGGQDNLEAVVKASELAGETTDGAVLWIHGPQPALNREIYPMEPCAAKPAFYELPLDTGYVDTVEFFKNHPEIGPFVQVAHNASLSADLDRFFARWQPGGHDYVVGLSQVTLLPKNLVPVSDQAAGELIALHANQQCQKLLALGKPEEARKIAMAYGLVTPVSSAVVNCFAHHATVDRTCYGDTNSQLHCRSVGAVCGLRSPTKGEMFLGLLWLLCCLLAFAGCLFGFATLLRGLLIRTKVGQLLEAAIQLTANRIVAIGIGTGLIFLSLAMHGIVNWFVHYALNANLFR